MLGVIGERPGVTARELAAASGVTGGTLYSLLRTLTQQGALEKRELPGGHTGYVVAASAAGAPAAVAPAGTTTEAGADAESRPAARLGQVRAGSTHAEDARSASTEARAIKEQASAPADAYEPSGQKAEK